MNSSQHLSALKNMYAAAPINDIYQPSIEISEGKAIIEIELSAKFHHSAGAVHGSVYFKLLDAAAFFAAQSFEKEVFVLTTAFTTYLTRPVSSGRLKAIGRVVNKNKTQFIAEAVVYDAQAMRSVAVAESLCGATFLWLKQADIPPSNPFNPIARETRSGVTATLGTVQSHIEKPACLNISRSRDSLGSWVATGKPS